MKITSAQLKAIMPNIVGNIAKNSHFAGYNLENIVALMNTYAIEFSINTPLRWAHYLAQIAHESAELRYSEEIASGKAYDTGKLAIKLGNTPEADGDGQKYKGRGLIQITGRANYADYKGYCGFDVIVKPYLLANPVGAVRSSMWFWKKKKLNELADRDDFNTITQRVNGGTNGLKERYEYLKRAKKALGIKG